MKIVAQEGIGNEPTDLPTVDRVVDRSPRSAGVLTLSPNVALVTGTPAGDPRAAPAEFRRNVAAALVAEREGTARLERRLRPTVGLDLERLNARIESATPWAVVVEAMGAASDAGLRRVAFELNGRSRATAPPKSSFHDRLAALANPAPPLLPRKPRFDVGTIWRDCPGFDPSLRAASGLAHSDKMERLAVELPRAVVACDCDVEISAVQEWFWAVNFRVLGPPLATVSVELAADEASAAHVLRFEPTTPWSRAYRAVVDAADRGGTVWFAESPDRG